jgi:hypothetical protein
MGERRRALTGCSMNWQTSAIPATPSESGSDVIALLLALMTSVTANAAASSTFTPQGAGLQPLPTVRGQQEAVIKDVIGHVPDKKNVTRNSYIYTSSGPQMRACVESVKLPVQDALA